MGRQRRNKSSPTPKQVPERHPVADETWDEVDQASWESFPASDSPGWAAPSGGRVKKPAHPKRPEGAEPGDRHA